MALPVVGGNLGSGADQIKSLVLGWIRDEIGAAARGGNVVIANLVTQQATLTAQVAALAAQNVQILALIGAQVLPAPFNNRTSGWALAASGEVKASVTLTIPVGFTKALVTATAYGNIVNSTGTAVNFYVWPIINGVPDDWGQAYLIAPGNFSAASISFSQLVVGLTGGGTFDVTANVKTGLTMAANGSNIASVNGTVLWVR
jgi:hypothetical protein